MQPEEAVIVHPVVEGPKNHGVAAGWMGILLPFVYGALGALVAVGVFTLVVPQHHPVAVVDVLKVMERSDSEAIEAIKRGDAEAARRASENRAKRGAELETLLEQLARDRGLVLVQKQAVLGGEAADLTIEVMLMLEKGR